MATGTGALRAVGLFDEDSTRIVEPHCGIKIHDPMAAIAEAMFAARQVVADGPVCDLRETWLAEKERGGAKRQTVSDLRSELRDWDRFWAAMAESPTARKLAAAAGQEVRSTGPNLSRIEQEHLENCHAWLVASKGGNATLWANKVCKAVRQLCRWAVEKGLRKSVPTWKSKAAKSVADKVYVAHGESEAASRVVLVGSETQPTLGTVGSETQPTLRSELQWLLWACAAAEWPDVLGMSAADWWRAAIVLWVLYGMRTQDLVSYEEDKRGLTWGCVRYDPQTPATAGRARFASGWLRYVPQKTERKKPEPIILPLHPVARRWLDQIRTPTAGESDAVFPWPRHQTAFYAAWRAIVRRAREESGVKTFDVLMPRHFRKTCSTWHKEIATLNGRQDEIADHVTGHAKRTISEKHYSAHENLLVEHFSWPQWDAWLAWDAAKAPTHRQLWLLD